MSFLLADPKNIIALMIDSGLFAEMESCDLEMITANGKRVGYRSKIESVASVKLEVPLTKGCGQYATIIGFIDACAKILGTDTYDDGEKCGFSFSLMIEAKPKIDNPMEVLRQVNTYKEFAKGKFLLWCPEISEKMKLLFRQQKIFVASLSIEALEKTELS